MNIRPGMLYLERCRDQYRGQGLQPDLRRLPLAGIGRGHLVVGEVSAARAQARDYGPRVRQRGTNAFERNVVVYLATARLLQQARAAHEARAQRDSPHAAG